MKAYAVGLALIALGLTLISLAYLALGISGVTLCVLMYCVVVNNNPERHYAAYCVFVVMSVSALLFETTIYNAAVAVFGLHVYLSLFETVLVLMLALRPSKLGYLMIGLSILAMVVNVMAYWVGLYADSTLMFEVLMYGLLMIQIALLLSKRLTNGIYRSLGSPAGTRVVRFMSNHIPNYLVKSKGQAG
jgi:hypothetical protein